MVAARHVLALTSIGISAVSGAVSPFNCGDAQSGYEIGKTPTAYTLAKIEVDPMRRTVLWDHTLGNGVVTPGIPTITDINACDISPRDDKMYCIVEHPNAVTAANTDFDLVRVDSADGTLAFVAAVLHNADLTVATLSFEGGTFDEMGNYIASATGNLQQNGQHRQGTYSIYMPDNLPEFGTQTNTPSLTKRSENVLGRDFVVQGGNIYTIMDTPPAVTRTKVTDATSGVANHAPFVLTATQNSQDLPANTKYHSMWTHEGDIYVQTEDQGLWKIEINEDKYTAEQVNTLVGRYTRDAGSCKWAPCDCPTTFNTQTPWCPVKDLKKQCPVKTCTCPNGAVAASCPADGLVACSSCSPGYHLVAGAQTKTCMMNTCTCSNGVPHEGQLCSANGSEECKSCNLGYQLMGDICIKKHKPVPKPKPKPTCFCNNGIADKHCDDPTQESCESCDTGFQLDGNTCVVSGDLGSMPPNPAVAPAAVGAALGGLGLGFGPSPSPRLFEDHVAANGTAASHRASGGMMLALMGGASALAFMAVALWRRRSPAATPCLERGVDYALAE